MQTLLKLQKGDQVEIIAPASRCNNEELHLLKELLESWDLKCIIDPNLLGDDLLFSNSDNNRSHLLKTALFRDQTKAIICVRGGYGSMRLIPELSKILPPKNQKIFIGMSDITALHLFLQQKWQWSVIHGSLSVLKFTKESIDQMKAILFGNINHVEFDGIPLNQAAKDKKVINAKITGGNLCVVQCSLGTIWQINSENKIIFLEEINERGYRIDRILNHLKQAGIFNQASAIIFGDFIGGKEPNGSSIIHLVLKRFALEINIPVVQVTGVGHDRVNFPLPLGMDANLYLDEKIKLTVLSRIIT